MRVGQAEAYRQPRAATVAACVLPMGSRAGYISSRQTGQIDEPTRVQQKYTDVITTTAFADMLQVIHCHDLGNGEHTCYNSTQLQREALCFFAFAVFLPCVAAVVGIWMFLARRRRVQKLAGMITACEKDLAYQRDNRQEYFKGRWNRDKEEMDAAYTLIERPADDLVKNITNMQALGKLAACSEWIMTLNSLAKTGAEILDLVSTKVDLLKQKLAALRDSSKSGTLAQIEDILAENEAECRKLQDQYTTTRGKYTLDRSEKDPESAKQQQQYL